jgi:hypothetical protein
MEGKEIEEKRRIDLDSIELKEKQRFDEGYGGVWFLDDPLAALFYERYFQNSLELLEYIKLKGGERVVAVMLARNQRFIDVLATKYELGKGQQLHLWRAYVI